MKLLRTAAIAGLLLTSASCALADAAKPMPRSLWAWDAGLLNSPERQPEFFAFCKEKNITRVYTSTGDIFSERKVAPGEKRHETPAQLGFFLKNAHAAGIKVEGLDGDPSFALEGKHELALARLKNALAYNKTAAPNERLDGFQWDTEPYLLAEYRQGEAGMKSVFTQYLTTVTQMCEAVKDEKYFDFGYAIPSFFDTPGRSVAWKGVNKPVGFHLMDMLNELPSGYVALMSYRDKADGGSGTIAISSGEVEYAAKNAPKVKVWIGQEVNKAHGTDPQTITFYEEGEDAMEGELAKIQTAFGGNPVVGGLALHHWAAYKIMPKVGPPAN